MTGAGTKTQHHKAVEMTTSIVREGKKGMSAAEIGTKLHLNRHAVSSVLRDNGIGTPNKRSADRIERREEVLGLVRDNPSCSIKDLSEWTGLNPHTVAGYLAGTDEESLIITRNAQIVQYTKADMKRSLQRVFKENLNDAERKKGMSRELYDVHRIRGVDPSPAHLVQVYGSWTSALKAARVRHGRAVRTDYRKTYTDEQCWEAAREYLDHAQTTGERPTVLAFTDWCRSFAGTIPSAPLVLNRCGRWSDIRRAILLSDLGLDEVA